MDAAQLEHLLTDQIRRNDEQAKVMAEQTKVMAEQAKTIAELRDEIARLKKGPGNSSKPPSSDFFKNAQDGKDEDKKGKKNKKKRKIGGQPGHKIHERIPFPEDQVDNFVKHIISAKEAARRGLVLKGWLRHQQVELPEKPFIVTEHWRAVYFDPKQGRNIAAPLADEACAHLLSPRLKAMIAFMHASMHASVESIRQYLESVMGLKVSDGTVANAIRAGGDGLAQADAELLAALPKEASVHVDETGHYRNGKLLWCWIFVAKQYSIIRTGLSRKAEVLLGMLGTLFDGLIHSDYYGAYRRFKKWAQAARFQFCLAHLVRDLKFLAEHPSAIAKAWGKGMLTLIRKMLQARQNGANSKEVERLTAALTKQCADKLAQKDAERVARRLRNHMECFVRFLADPLAEATNNRAERGLRPTVLHRKCTQGTRSEAGDRTHERLQTLVATARQQGRSAYAFLVKAIEATMRGTMQPSMLNGW